jgi:hypothetical protein
LERAGRVVTQGFGEHSDHVDRGWYGIDNVASQVATAETAAQVARRHAEWSQGARDRLRIQAEIVDDVATEHVVTAFGQLLDGVPPNALRHIIHDVQSTLLLM